MKAGRIILLLSLLASTAALVVGTGLQSSVGAPLDQALVVAVPEVVFPLEDSAVSAEPSPPEEMPPVVEAPVAVEEPKQPVQSLAERGDAMLFESEALMGTPFDQAIVMPFD